MTYDDGKTGKPVEFLGPPVRGIDQMPGRDPLTGGVAVLPDPVPIYANVASDGTVTVSHETTTASDTIFGLSPLTLGVIAIAAYFFFTSK